MTGESEPPSLPPETEEPDDGEGQSPWWERLLRLGENVLNLEKSVAALKAENKQLRRDLQDLQLQVGRLAGKLEGVSEVVTGAIEDKIEAKVAKAELRIYERLISMLRGSPRNIE